MRNSSLRSLVSLSVFVAAALATMSEARAVIVSSGTTGRNTTAPLTSEAGLDAWNLEAYWGYFLATPIDATHFIAASHVSPSSTINFQGTNYTVDLTSRKVDPNTDLCVYSITGGAFPTYATLYDTAIDGTEVNKTMIVIGRGTARGEAVTVNSVLKGWKWGDGDGVKSWGMNVVRAVDSSWLGFTFDSVGIANEATLSVGDSSGAVFIYSQGQWKLAGINYAVDGPYSYTGVGDLDPAGTDEYTAFYGAIKDTLGLYEWDWDARKWVLHTTSTPQMSYDSRISSRLSWIQSAVAVPEPGSLTLLAVFFAAVLPFGWFARRARSA